MPELDAVAPELQARGIGVLALSVNGEADSVQAAVRQLGLRMPVALTEHEVLAPNGLRGVPSMLFVDSTGTVVDAHNGRESPARMRERAMQLLR